MAVVGVDRRADVTVLADGTDVGSAPAALVGGAVGLSGGGSTFATLKLRTSLQQGQKVTAVQTVDGGTSSPSTVPVVVIGMPSHLNVPRVRTFPVAGVEAMLVRQLFPGAQLIVRLLRGGASSTRTVDVDDFAQIAPTPSPLRIGDHLQVIQQLGNVSTVWSAPKAIESWGSREGQLADAGL